MRLSRGLRRLLLAVILYFTVCLVGGFYLADGTLHPGKRPLSDDDVTAVRNSVNNLRGKLSDASITTPDAVNLQAWLLTPQHPNGDAAILLHGLSDNRLGTVGYAEILLARGFTILMPDARAHGQSGGDFATYGLLERNDIHQWADFVSSQVHPRCLYGLGESMGAAELLQSLQVGTTFCAVIAESSFASFPEIAYDRMGQPFHLGPWVGRTILRPLIEVAFLRVRWKYKLDMHTISPEDAVAQTHIPVLLIHGEIDSNIPLRHSRLISTHNPKAVLWEVPHADHCGGISVAPKEFERRLLQWFSSNPQERTISAMASD
jgi:pimeloyl-ACP methyl ester carboxylesterase